MNRGRLKHYKEEARLLARRSKIPLEQAEFVVLDDILSELSNEKYFQEMKKLGYTEARIFKLSEGIKI